MRLTNRFLAIGAIVGALALSLGGCLPKVPECPQISQGSNNVQCVPPVQARLSGLGYMYFANTSHFGSATTDGVKKFQATHGLAADGIVGTATRDVLNATSPKTMANAYGVMPACVQWPTPIVCANKASNVAILFVNGQNIGMASTRFGEQQVDGRGEPTQEGLFTSTPDLLGAAAISTKYDNAPIPWFVGFYNGEGLHFSRGFGPGETSHGCIRLNDEEFAHALWNISSIYGLTVFVYDTRF
jgi:hypothetical protein